MNEVIKYNELKKASELEKKDLIAKGLKLTEEVGELSSRTSKV